MLLALLSSFVLTYALSPAPAGSINGYFLINYSFVHTFWGIETQTTYTDVGIVPNATAEIYITESEGDVEWSFPSEASQYISGTTISNDGKHVYFRTNNRIGDFSIMATDDSGTPLTIKIYISTGGLSR